MAPRSRSSRTSASTNKPSTKKSTTKQSSLSFQNRITKPSSSQSISKDNKASEAAEAKAAKLLEEVDEIKLESTVETKPKEAKKLGKEEQEEAEEEIVPAAKQIPIRSQNQYQGPEAKARRIPDAQIKRYWRGKEAERKTKRFHQEGLSLYEKILREFDMSNQYGPCIGITRSRRWTRAEKLGLQPPIEVLAVLVKEDDNQTDKKFERAQMDVLVNSRLGVVA